MKTLFLNPQTWDLEVDVNGNTAVADSPYSMAQDAASAIRCFAKDCYYDQKLGIPYFEKILGRFPPVEYMRSQFVAAAKSVPGVVNARCFITSIDERSVHGQIQVTDKNNFTVAAGF